MKTTYEWSHEETDKYGDIINVDFADRLRDLNEEPTCLVKRMGDEAGGEDNRTYAYLNDGELPERFENGTPVPARFKEELKRYNA